MACGIFIGIRGNLGRLLLDSGVVDVTISYNAICTSRIILEGIVFQEPYKRVEPSRHPCEHKTLESNKSLTILHWASFLPWVRRCDCLAMCRCASLAASRSRRK